MAIDISSIQTFTDAELLILVRSAIAQITVGGQAYTAIGNRTLTRADLSDLRAAEVDLQSRIEESANGRMTAYGSFNRPA